MCNYNTHKQKIRINIYKLTYSKLAYSKLTHSKLAHSKLAHSKLVCSKLAHSKLAYSKLAHSKLAHNTIEYCNLADRKQAIANQHNLFYFLVSLLTERKRKLVKAFSLIGSNGEPYMSYQSHRQVAKTLVIYNFLVTNFFSLC